MGGGPGPKRTGAICRKVLTALVHPYQEKTPKFERGCKSINSRWYHDQSPNLCQEAH